MWFTSDSAAAMFVAIVTLMVTIGLIVALHACAASLWSSNSSRIFRPLFPAVVANANAATIEISLAKAILVSSGVNARK
jgi:hypothetical protein